MKDTIFALSSGQPPAGIGIIRISGPVAGMALRALASCLPIPRRATLAHLRDPASGALLDEAIILWFPGPATATGEDLAELHCHGGRAVIARVLDTLGRLADMRMAEPGEFTRRAFENGRIDLNEAEGLGDLLRAETETQRRSAMAMSGGHFSQRVTRWQERLLQLSAMAEAALDFSDEDDVPDDDLPDRIRAGTAALALAVGEALTLPHAERLRDGIRVVIAGPPNAGKSTLLNALAGREAAIVSDIAGTTRDRIEVPVALGGIAFLLTDTAGLRTATDDRIEQIGMQRAQDAMADADVILWLGGKENLPSADSLLIAAQCDRVPGDEPAGLNLSAVTGEGMTALIEELISRAQTLLPREGEYALHARQRDALAALADALHAAGATMNILIVAEYLRISRGALDRLTGRASTEDMLDTLFSGFCIGK